MALIRLKLAEVPLYLRGGGFYESLLDTATTDSDSEMSWTQEVEAATVVALDYHHHTEKEEEKEEEFLAQQKDDDDDDDYFEVPALMMKKDTAVESTAELLHLLETLRYWQCAVCPVEVIAFCLKTIAAAAATREVAETEEAMSAATAAAVMELLEAFCVQLSQLDSLLAVLKAADKAATAAALGDLIILRWLHLYSSSNNISNDDSSDSNNCSIARWTPAVCTAAARHGHLHCLQYLRTETHCPWNEDTCLAAYQQEQLHCLTFAIRNHCPCPSTMPMVEFRGELSFVGILYFRGYIDCVAAAECAMTVQSTQSAQELMKCAVMGGHLAAMRYLVEQHNFCSWDESICEEAAMHNRLECLQYARSSGCPWSEATCASAARFGSLRCLRYAVEHGCPVTEKTMEVAFWRADVSIMQFLRSTLYLM